MFTAMLDPETTTVLMTKGIYGNYKKSRKELGNRQVELADDGASDPMDIGLAKHCWLQNHSVVSTHTYITIRMNEKGHKTQYFESERGM